MLSTLEMSNDRGWVPHRHPTHHQFYHLQPNHGHVQHQTYMHDHDQQIQEYHGPPRLGIDDNKCTKISYKTGEEDRIVTNNNKRPAPTVDQSTNYQDDRIEVEVVSPTRVCIDCKSSKTPLWRSGPSGPKTLCNACGIRYRKKRRREFELLKMKFKGQEEETEAALLLMALSCADHHQQ